MTDNKYWLYLESLRRSGVTNMYGASPYLQDAFGLSRPEANNILADWMRNYKREDYEGFVEGRHCDICGKAMKEGYFVSGTYYCSNECLHEDYSEEQFDELYEDGDAYWTEWEETELGE